MELNMMRVLLAALLLASPAVADGRVECLISNVRSFAGWNAESQDIWLKTMQAELADRILAFRADGSFKGRTHVINGNTGGIRSVASMDLIERNENSVSSGKVATGVLPGGQIETYEIKSGSSARAAKVIEVRDAAFLIPMEAPALARLGIHSSDILFDADCSVGSGPETASIAPVVAPIRARVRKAVKAIEGALP